MDSAPIQTLFEKKNEFKFGMFQSNQIVCCCAKSRKKKKDRDEEETRERKRERKRKSEM